MKSLLFSFLFAFIAVATQCEEHFLGNFNYSRYEFYLNQKLPNDFFSDIEESMNFYQRRIAPHPEFAFAVAKKMANKMGGEFFDPTKKNHREFTIKFVENFYVNYGQNPLYAWNMLINELVFVQSLPPQAMEKTFSLTEKISKAYQRNFNQLVIKKAMQAKLLPYFKEMRVIKSHSHFLEWARFNWPKIRKRMLGASLATTTLAVFHDPTLAFFELATINYFNLFLKNFTFEQIEDIIKYGPQIIGFDNKKTILIAGTQFTLKKTMEVVSLIFLGLLTYYITDNWEEIKDSIGTTFWMFYYQVNRSQLQSPASPKYQNIDDCVTQKMNKWREDNKEKIATTDEETLQKITEHFEETYRSGYCQKLFPDSVN